MIGLAAVAAVTLSLIGPSGAMADTPIPTPASDPMPLPAGEPVPVPANEPVPTPAHITVTNMPGFGAPKPHAVHTNTATPAVSYVGLAALPANEPVYGEIPLMAQTDQDLTTTPYYILIVDSSTGQVVRACGTGTQCGVYVSSTAAISKNYVAYVAPWASTLNGIQDIQAFSQPETVEWFHVCG
jgi:hypothetical protein